MATPTQAAVSYGIRARHLQSWREYRLVTRFGLSKASGVSRFTIRRIEEEGAVAHRATIDKLAKALDVTPEQLCREAPTDGAA